MCPVKKINGVYICSLTAIVADKQIFLFFFVSFSLSYSSHSSFSTSFLFRMSSFGMSKSKYFSVWFAFWACLVHTKMESNVVCFINLVNSRVETVTVGYFATDFYSCQFIIRNLDCFTVYYNTCIFGPGITRSIITKSNDGQCNNNNVDELSGLG